MDDSIKRKCYLTTEKTPKILYTSNLAVSRSRYHENPFNKTTINGRHFHLCFDVRLLNACFFIILLSVTTTLWSEVCASLPSLPPVIRLGAIFTEDQRASKIESAFKYAIYRINKDKTMLPDTQIVYDIEYIPRDDTFRSTKKVCRQLESGVQAIFGPTDRSY